MGIKANFTTKDIERQLRGWVGSVKDASVQALVALCKKCVGYARANNGFDDETGNLVSSIGGKVFVDGKPVYEDYVQVLDGSEGVSKGQALADQVGSRCGHGQSLCVVTAGEDYAIFLESNGIDVISGSEGMARQEWPEMKRRLDEMIRRQAK